MKSGKAGRGFGEFKRKSLRAPLHIANNPRMSAKLTKIFLRASGTMSFIFERQRPFVLRLGIVTRPSFVFPTGGNFI